VTRADHVRDALTLVRHLGLAPVTLIGQSLGGHTAMLLASAHPDAVEALVMIEAGPAGGEPDLPDVIGRWLDSWPTPFNSRAQAGQFLGHEAWARGLEERADGLHPRFDRATIVDTTAELATHTYWSEWSGVRCPTLVVRGTSGTMRATEAADMLRHRPTTRLAVVEGAGHDVHLDRPEQLHTVIASFLTPTDPSTG
jgi:pimeloyl-ACP methyl ester carboxylesterase